MYTCDSLYYTIRNLVYVFVESDVFADIFLITFLLKLYLSINISFLKRFLYDNI